MYLTQCQIDIYGLAGRLKEGRRNEGKKKGTKERRKRRMRHKKGASLWRG